MKSIIFFAPALLRLATVDAACGDTSFTKCGSYCADSLTVVEKRDWYSFNSNGCSGSLCHYDGSGWCYKCRDDYCPCTVASGTGFTGSGTVAGGGSYTYTTKPGYYCENLTQQCTNQQIGTPTCYTCDHFFSGCTECEGSFNSNIAQVSGVLKCTKCSAGLTLAVPQTPEESYYDQCRTAWEGPWWDQCFDGPSYCITDQSGLKHKIDQAYVQQCPAGYRCGSRTSTRWENGMLGGRIRPTSSEDAAAQCDADPQCKAFSIEAKGYGTVGWTYAQLYGDGFSGRPSTMDEQSIWTACIKGCCDPGSHDWSCCSPTHPCDKGMGDCDSDNDCGAGLKCMHDTGKGFGANSVMDVCWDDTCNVANEDWYCCSPDNPCVLGHGHCASDNDCVGDLVCNTDYVHPTMGAWESYFNVCAEEHSTPAPCTSIACLWAQWSSSTVG